MTTTGFNLQTLVASAGGSGPATTFTGTTVSWNSRLGQTFTWTFSDTVTYGYYADGSPFVIEDPTVQMTGYTPAPSQVTGYDVNGMMVNPAFVTGFDQGPQGWSELIFALPGSRRTVYDTAVNLGLQLPLTMDLGANQKNSYVIARHEAGTTNADVTPIDGYGILTLVASVPDVNQCRPGVGGTADNSRNLDDVTYTPARRAIPSSFPDVDTIMLDVPEYNALVSHPGESQRRLRAYRDVSANSGYSADIVIFDARQIIAMNSSAPTTAQLRVMQSDMLAKGADLEAAIDSGFVNPDQIVGTDTAGAGQGAGFWVVAAGDAMMRQDATFMAKIEATGYWQALTNGVWIGPHHIGNTAQSGQGTRSAPFYPEQLDGAWCLPDEFSGNHAARYRAEATQILVYALCAIGSFEDGPPGFTSGADVILAGGPNNRDNPRAAGLNYLAVARQELPTYWSVRGMNAAAAELIDDFFARGTFSPLPLSPQVPPMGDVAPLEDGYVSNGGDGEMVFDVPAGLQYGYDVATQVDVRYALRGSKQWVEVLDVTLPHTVTGLARGAEYVGALRWGSPGAMGPWSYNFPREQSDTDLRSSIIVAGSVSAAVPNNIVAPEITRRQFPNWTEGEDEAFIPCPTNPTLDEITELAIGWGAYDGDPPTGGTYEWRRNGGIIGGESGQTYTPNRVDDAGATIEGRFTPSNGTGSASQLTAPAIVMPTVPTLPSDVLVAANFKQGDVWEYETQIADAIANSTNASVSHQPFLGARNPDVSFDPGQLFLEYAGSQPTLLFPCKNPAVPGTTYNVTIGAQRQTGIVFPLRIDVVNGAGNSVLTGGQQEFSNTLGFRENAHSLTDTIVVAGGETDLNFRVRMQIGSSTGGTSAGLTGADIREAA